MAAITRAGMQFMPAQDMETLATLREDIRHHGVQVPVVVDQHGRILDGNNRKAIATELGVDCPTEVVHVADDAEAEERALALNMMRRHMTQEQRRKLIADQLQRHPELSDREIARRTGSTHPTVAKVRHGGKSYRREMSVSEAREITDKIKTIAVELDENTQKLLDDVTRLFWLLATNGVDVFRVLLALQDGRSWIREHGRDQFGEVFAIYLDSLYDEYTRTLLDSEMRALFEEDARGPEFLPVDAETIDKLLERLAVPVTGKEAGRDDNA